MPNPHIRMSIIREVLRLKYESRLSHRQIARALKVSIGQFPTICCFLSDAVWRIRCPPI